MPSERGVPQRHLRSRLRASALLVLPALLAACQVAPQLRDRMLGREATRTVLLVSIDGFHPDYLDRGRTPVLQRLADEGVRARWMQPSFPSKTFPNHYTVVTGLRPDHHGIVDNQMVDPELGRFATSDRRAVGDGRWWGGEPIWVSAHRQGLRSATMFWPGSEAAIGGVRPEEWSPFDAARPPDELVDIVLGWLARPPRQRPHFATLYLVSVDVAGHRHGPESPEVDAELARVDAAMGRLVDGIATLGLADAVDLVIVSDHGMAELGEGQQLVVEDLVDPAAIELVSLSQLFSVNPRPGREAEVEAALLAPREGLDCHRKAELPAAWQYGSHPRIPAVVCLLHEGWRIRRRDAFNPWPESQRNRGDHGYDPASPAMRALFIAHGPSFAAGQLVDPLDNVDVYPLLAALLGIAPAPGDHDPAVAARLLRASALPPATTSADAD